ncbi:S1C family serine protease [Sutterella sp.]|uniref:S1C family serine protease n=1 Tax=Sutterella sp. TaxID=1981025 RepID=UPI0026E0A836|nr:trypsin-like peptidase domain-containing protein [Sutterella sp.]MDO5531286.1 trypsin-like peptidase domain-containing protein [Sutterella sp.]
MTSPAEKPHLARKLWLLFSQAVTVGCAGALVWKLFAPAIPAQDPLAEHLTILSAQNDFSSAVERAAPSVVNIFTRKQVTARRAEEIGVDWNGDPEVHMKALGSGVIVSGRGDILTNYHVVDGFPNIFVALADGRTFEARLRGWDVETDLALLEVKAKNLPAIEIADSTELKVGQTVLAIGNPFDVGQTVTSGIISALGRHGFGLNNYEDFIQTDAAINQGNSGGALVNLEGELIGINSAIFSPDRSEGFVGIGFAIPSSIITAVLPGLMSEKQIERGYLGFVPRQLSQELAQDLSLRVSSGVLVKQVIPESPAAKADIRSFDVILEVDGKPVSRANRLLQTIARIKPGAAVNVKILRGERVLTKRLIASARPQGALEKEALIPPQYEE